MGRKGGREETLETTLKIVIPLSCMKIKTYKELDQGQKELNIWGLLVICFQDRKLFHVLLYVTVGSFESTHYHNNSELWMC